MRESSSSNAERADAGEKSYGHHVLHGHVCDAHPTAFLDAFEEILDECVHPLAKALEHDESQRDSKDSVKHAEGLSRVSPRSCMPVA